MRSSIAACGDENSRRLAVALLPGGLRSRCCLARRRGGVSRRRPATSRHPVAGEPVEVYVVGFSGACDCCFEHVGLCPGRGPSGRRRQFVVACEGWSPWKSCSSGSLGWTSPMASVTVCVRTPGPPGPRGGRRSETRTFSTMSRSLLVMRDWLLESGVSIAAMESTSTQAEGRVLLPGGGAGVLAAGRRAHEGCPGPPNRCAGRGVDRAAARARPVE